MGSRRWIGFVAVVLVLAGTAWGSVDKDFVSPPDEARPWVYRFWLKGNITREGTTGDIETMRHFWMDKTPADH